MTRETLNALSGKLSRQCDDSTTISNCSYKEPTQHLTGVVRAVEHHDYASAVPSKDNARRALAGHDLLI